MALWQKGLRMAVGKMPKVIDPTTHAVVDYAVAGSLLLMGILFWKRNKRAAVSSLVCGGAAAANIWLTDYPGGAHKVISYKAHGHIDTGIAGMTAGMPRLLRFEDEPEARFFEIEALAKTAIVGLTDFDYYERTSQRRVRRHKDDEDFPQDVATK
jgi:hypothetical protein